MTVSCIIDGDTFDVGGCGEQAEDRICGEYKVPGPVIQEWEAAGHHHEAEGQHWQNDILSGIKFKIIPAIC